MPNLQLINEVEERALQQGRCWLRKNKTAPMSSVNEIGAVFNTPPIFSG